MKSKFIILTFFVISLFYTGTAYSQKKGDDIWQKIEKIKLEKLIKRLDLDETTAKTFSEKYIGFSKTIRALNQKRTMYFKLMAENLDSGDGLDSLVDGIVNTENEINQTRMDFAADLKTILTSKQIAIMIIFERKFNIELRKLIKTYNDNKKKPDNN